MNDASMSGDEQKAILRLWVACIRQAVHDLTACTKKGEPDRALRTSARLFLKNDDVVETVLNHYGISRNWMLRRVGLA